MRAVIAALAGGELIVGRQDGTAVQAEVRWQATAPTYKLDNQGRRMVESKADAKQRLRLSPDDMDAVKLAYLKVPSVSLGKNVIFPVFPLTS